MWFEPAETLFTLSGQQDTHPPGTTPRIGLGNPALDHRPQRIRPLPDRDETELVQAAEPRQVRVSEGSLKHIEVLWIGSIGTPIIRGPRHLPRPTATPSSVMSP